MVPMLAFAVLLALLVVSVIGCAIVLRVLAEVAIEAAEHAVAGTRALVSRDPAKPRARNRPGAAAAVLAGTEDTVDNSDTMVLNNRASLR